MGPIHRQADIHSTCGRVPPLFTWRFRVVWGNGLGLCQFAPKGGSPSGAGASSRPGSSSRRSSRPDRGPPPVSRSIPPPWRSIRFRLTLRTYAPWGVRVVSQTKSRKIPTRKILPLFLAPTPSPLMSVAPSGIGLATQTSGNFPRGFEMFSGNVFARVFFFRDVRQLICTYDAPPREYIVRADGRSRSN